MPHGEGDGMVDTDNLDPDSSQEDSGDDDDEDDDDYDVRRDDGGEPVKFFTNELAWRSRLHRRLITKPTSRIWSAGFDLVAKVLVCVLYVIRVCLDDPTLYACDGHPCSAEQTKDPRGSVFSSTSINWHVIVWVHRPIALWVVQVVLCLLTSCKAVLYVSIAIKGSVWYHLLTRTFLLEMIFSLPLVFTVFYPVMLMDLFVPLFLNCWMAKSALRRLMNDLHLTKQKFQTLSVTLNQQICFVAVSILCIIFTTICGIQHIQRGSADRPLTLFEAVYFTIVTLTTVGYGDISPDIWLGQLFMLLMICVAFVVIPKEIEEIGSTWAQRKKTGGDYAERRAEKGKHVVVCATSFSADVVMNFLNEFYEHPKVQEHTVILMSSEELDSNMLFILKDPKWAHRVVYIKGSPLKDIDLKRCRINHAESVFFLCNKNCCDQEKSDQHTILRSWAVKDFAPSCRQYIQLFKATNKQHVRFAEHVICEDEFKFALLANNCLYPGLSTFLTLILFTSRGKEGQLAKEPWQQVYGRHSGNQIYHIQLSKSVFFNRFEGKSFVQASAEVHEKFGVCLLAVLDSSNNELRLKLNPGPDYILKGNDYCFYMSKTNEEYTEVTMMLEEDHSSPVDNLKENEGSVFSLLSVSTSATESAEDTAPSEDPERTAREAMDQRSDRPLQLFGLIGQDSIMAGPLPHSMAVGTKRIICHLHCDPRPLCCTAWGTDCEHCQFKNAGDSRWTKQLIIVAVDECSPAVYNFIIPLRSSHLSLGSLYPVVLMVENKPDSLFLDSIAHFPLVFWMQGSLESLDDLLRAGVHKAIHLVISNTGTSHDSGTEERLDDAQTVVMVQKITRLFPSLNILTDLKEDSNMRFMHFQAHDFYTQQISRLEKRLKEKTSSNLPYMFRLPFAAGQVFSSAMLDRLLYQTFVKGYLICFVRLLLGIDAQKRSGHLSCVHVSRATIAQFPTYGALYQSLCSTTGEIPIALYRTKRRPGFNPELQPNVFLGNNNSLSLQKGRPSIGGALFQRVEDYANVGGFINSRLQRLQLGMDEPYVRRKSPRALSYTTVNPSHRRKLKKGDIVYVLQPSFKQATPKKTNRRDTPRQHTTRLSHMFKPPTHPECSASPEHHPSRHLRVKIKDKDCGRFARPLSPPQSPASQERLKVRSEECRRPGESFSACCLSDQQESVEGWGEDNRRPGESSSACCPSCQQESVEGWGEGNRPPYESSSPRSLSDQQVRLDVQGEDRARRSCSLRSLSVRKEGSNARQCQGRTRRSHSPTGRQTRLEAWSEGSGRPAQSSPVRSLPHEQEGLQAQCEESRQVSQSSSPQTDSLPTSRATWSEESIQPTQPSSLQSDSLPTSRATWGEESIQPTQSSSPQSDPLLSSKVAWSVDISRTEEDELQGKPELEQSSPTPSSPHAGYQACSHPEDRRHPQQETLEDQVKIGTGPAESPSSQRSFQPATDNRPKPQQEAPVLGGSLCWRLEGRILGSEPSSF